jgi:hypothetical protein
LDIKVGGRGLKGIERTQRNLYKKHFAIKGNDNQTCHAKAHKKQKTSNLSQRARQKPFKKRMDRHIEPEELDNSKSDQHLRPEKRQTSTSSKPKQRLKIAEDTWGQARAAALQEMRFVSLKDVRQLELDDETFKGITARPGGRWQAQLYFRGKSRYIGVFGSPHEACLAYKLVQKRLLRPNNLTSASVVRTLFGDDRKDNRGMEVAMSHTSKRIHKGKQTEALLNAPLCQYYIPPLLEL